MIVAGAKKASVLTSDYVSAKQWPVIYGRNPPVRLKYFVAHLLSTGYCLFTLIVGDFSFAQEFSRRVPVVRDAAFSAGASPIAPHGKISWSLSATHLNWERVLSRPHFDLPAETNLTGEQLCRWLTAKGVPTRLDQSAMDDGLGPDDVVNLNFGDLPLRDRLMIALNKRNATLAYRENHVLIISLDSAGNEDFFNLVVYDISNLFSQEDAIWFLIHITTVITPDDWQQTQGDQTITILRNARQVLVTVSAPIETHWKIKNHLEDLMSMSRISPVNLSSGFVPLSSYSHYYGIFENQTHSQTNVSGTSTIVEIPKRSPKMGITIPGSNPNGGGGMGGMGGMMSVGSFAIPDVRRAQQGSFSN